MLFFALFACGGAPSVEAPVPAPVTVQPAPFALSSGPTAEAPHLTHSAEGLVLSWWETDGTHQVLRAASVGADGMHEPVQVQRVDDALINFADVPTVSHTPRGWLATWPGNLNEHAYDVAVGKSSDGGQWTDAGTAHDDGTATEHGFASVAFDAQHTWLFWLDGRANVEGGPMGLRVREVGAAAEASTVIDSRVCDCCGTDAVITAKGPIVAYRDRSETEVRDVSVARMGAEGWTSGPVADDAWTIQGCPVNGPALDADGEQVSVAWYTEGGGARVRFAASSTSAASFGPPVDVASGDDVLGRVDVVLLPDGRSVVSWIERDGERSALVRARVVDGGSAGEVIDLGRTTPTRSAGFPVVASLDGALLWVWTVPGEGLSAVTVGHSEL